MATVGSALECKLRLAFSSALSRRDSGLWLPDELERCDLSDLLPKLKPRWCLGATMAPIGLYTPDSAV